MTHRRSPLVSMARNESADETARLQYCFLSPANPAYRSISNSLSNPAIHPALPIRSRCECFTEVDLPMRGFAFLGTGTLALLACADPVDRKLAAGERCS